MRKLFLFFVALLATSTLWAYDFQSGDLYYNITSSVEPYTVEVTYEIYWSCDNYSNLKDVVIPEKVTHDNITYLVTGIGQYAFWSSCFPSSSQISSIVIPNSVTSIGDDAFHGCSSLTSIIVKEGNTTYDSRNDCNAIIETATNTLIAGCQNTIIPNSVTSIGEGAFYSCSSLTSITIPNSVTSIGDGAFNGCSSLTSMTIGNSVTNIGYSAFSGCSSLTSITIPNSVTSIRRNAFNGCSSLISVLVESGNTTYDSRENCNAIIKTATNTLIAGCQNTIIPNSVTSIDWFAFDGCSSLTSITIPNSVTSIGSSAFSYCSALTSVTIGNSVTSIGSYAFSGCSSLTSITIPNSVTSIGSYAFVGTGIYNDISNWENDVLYIDNCLIEAQTSISGTCHIKKGTRIIATGAFEDCSSLKAITIPNSVTHFGSHAFTRCSSLESIFCYNAIPPCFSGFGVYDNEEFNATLYVPDATKYKADYFWKHYSKIISIGDDIMFLDNGIYYNIISTESILSLSLLTQEHFNKFTTISITGSQNWHYDSKYGAKMSGYSDSDQKTYQNEDWLISPALDLSQYSSATLEFSHAFGPNASVPTTATQKAQYTVWVSNDFNGNVATATWTELPISYGTSAWRYISTVVDIPTENLKENCCIAWKYVCKNSSATWEIESVDVVASPKQKRVEVISNPNKYSGDIVVPAFVTINDTAYNVVSIGGRAFYGCSSLTSITIPNNVTSIGEDAFSNCSSLTSIILTAPSVEEFCQGQGNHWLRVRAISCERKIQIDGKEVTEITIPNSVTSIGDDAFSNCSSLTSITIPNSVTSIGRYAFSGCSSLTSITIPNSVTSIGRYAFSGCSSLITITLGNSVTNIEKNTFLDCSSLSSVTIPNSVTNIGQRAFENCTSLNEITLPASVKSIDEEAFAGCTKLYDIYCFAMEPPTAYESSFANYNAFLHVPCDNQRVYLLDVVFGEFKYIECIEAETATTDTVVVDPSFNDAEFTWPSNSDADTYTLAISKDGEVFCTLTFNANGQLTGIAFAPSRNGQRHAPAAVQAANGFTFTVTGLDEGSVYTYDLVIKDSGDNTLQTYSGEFRTQSTNDRTVIVEYDVAQGQVTGAGLYQVGDIVTLTAIPNEGYQFVAWGDGNTDNPRTLVVTQDTTLTALFEVLTYNVTVTCDPIHGSVTGSGTYNHGDVATLTAIPNEGYQFVTWGDGNTDNPRTLVVTQDTTLTALFEALTYNVTVTCDPEHGIVSGGGVYQAGETATLTATPKDGYEFVRWSDDNTTNPRTLTVTKDLTLTAEFAVIEDNNLSLISVRDGTLSDWDDLPEEYLFETQCAEGSSWNALKSVKVYVDSTYINLVVEWDSEIVTDLSSVPFQVYLNVDNDAPTGGFSDLWIKPNIDLLLEGNFYFDGFPCAYQPVVALYAGTPLANEWTWNLISIESVAANQLITKGVMEIQIDYGKLPVKLENTFTVGFSIQQSWTPVGVLPNAANDNTGNRVLAEKMLIRINNVNTPASIENTHSQSSMTNCQKIIRNGQLLIIRDGKTYNTMGAEIR